MKILFVENQYKTYFFEPIAKRLQDQGHDVFWIVQNKLFTPKGDFKKYIIPYPDNNNYQAIEDSYIDDIIASDRNLNYFKYSNKSHFYYYNEKIEKLIHTLLPEVVFGECTLFHELLIGKHCRSLGIKYLNPLPCRYPTGKFSFYLYDTAKPFHGSGEVLPDDEAKAIIDNITHRKIKPDYMKPVVMSTYEKLKNKLQKTAGYYLGDQYNTPSPFVKLKIEKERAGVIQLWDSKAMYEVDKTTDFRVLYPLQVQPEENIDVMGRKRRNQLAVIKEIAENLPNDAILYVKPNPKPRYEVTKEMVEFLSKAKNIKMIHHSVSMTQIFKDFDLIVTVTGTVAIESLFANKPVVNLIQSINNTVKNCVYLEDLTDLPEIINTVKNNTFPKASIQDKIEFINLLNKTSYYGNISDVLSDKNCIDDENITLIMKAFDDVLNEIEKKSTTLKAKGF